MTCEEKDLPYLQNLSLKEKVKQTKMRIVEWYSYFDGKIYISFSGGKDSTVLLHIARQLYPDVEAVFIDTGLEFPEIKDFVRTVENVTWIKPKIPFNQVLKKYGWPIVSKEQAKYIKEVQKGTTEYTRNKRLYGKNGSRTGMISKKWQYLIDAPFKISEVCCDVMKKRPAHQFKRQSGKVPVIGTMANDSSLRKQSFLRYGCNSFNDKNHQSRPLMFWSEKDIWEYIKNYKINYCNIYDLGYERTGCVFCLFGHHMDIKRGKNRIELLKITHPKLYEYCINKLGMKEVLEWYPKKK